MQLLSSIADLKDIVNKEYIDSILADYVLSANLGALATKDSLAFSDLTSRPSKLSDFTDDVVAGKYLELSGGRMQGSINWAIEQTSAWDNFFNTGSNLGLRILNTAGYSVEGAPSDYAVGLIVSGYYGYALAWDANNEQLKYRGSGKSDWRTLVHSGNVGDYALPLTGGTITGQLILQSGRDVKLILDNTDSEQYNQISIRENGVEYAAMYWTREGTYLNGIGNFYYNSNTLIHSGNYSSYALPLSGGTISGDTDALKILRNTNGYSAITYYNTQNGATTLLGVMGFDSNGEPSAYRASDNAWRTLIHSGNIGSQIVEGITTHTGDATNANGDIAKLNSYYSSKGFRISRFNGLNGLGIANSDGLIVNWPLDHSYGQQWYMDDESHTIQVRYVANAVWSDWKTIAFTDSNVASADSAKVISDYSNSRITSADVEVFGDSGVRKFIASSYMTSGKPPYDGSILHFSWDTTGGYEHQLFIASDKLATPEQRMAWRAQDAGVWGDWKTIAFTDSNVASATKLATARTIWGQSFDGTGNVSGTLKNVSWIELTGTNFGIYQGSALNSALTDNDIAFYSQKVYMSGNIGIGTTNPQYKLDVAGSIRTTSSLTIGTIVLTDENGTLKIAGNAYTTGQLATGEAGRPTSGGGSAQYWSNEYDMDIGTDVLVSSKEYIGTNTIVGWDLAGSCLNDLYIGYDGYTIWMQGSVDEASDMRLKTVIDAVNLDIRDIAYAPIFNYVFKSRPQGRQMLGSSAQYWQAIAPKAVSENDKGNLAMNYGAIALASVVAVAKKVVTHEEEIAELKSKVQSLETRLAKYELN